MLKACPDCDVEIFGETVKLHKFFNITEQRYMFVVICSECGYQEQTEAFTKEYCILYWNNYIDDRKRTE